MAKVCYYETGEILKTFDSVEEALDWIYDNCSVTLAWLTGAEEGAAYFHGERIDWE